ncbi:MAG TPA: hypothetical protein VMB66_04695 [Candidatus Acidoferrales bacterium]|jgi:hypothetical protein|nr:hypothetical protein [Candidatus Acidoferrales bacterium]
MTFHGLDLKNPPAPITPEVAQRANIEQQVRWQHALKGSSAWFLWVAGLSMVNSILHVSGVRFQFIFGLGIAQLVDALARRIGGAGLALDIVINGFLAGIFVVFFYFGRQGKRWAFLTGMILYGLDGLLMLLFQAFLGLAFHAFALFCMNGGLVAISKLQELEQPRSPYEVQGEQGGLFGAK